MGTEATLTAKTFQTNKGCVGKCPAAKVIGTVVKTTLLVLLLIYFFMCGVELLTTSFKLIAGRNVNELTRRGTLENPLVGLIVGVLVTIMVQSSSTSTAIIVSLVSSKVINIKQAIPVIMGSNIGTSVTNTFVSFTQVADRDTFERAFAGATLHDMFNWLSVSLFLSIEVITRSIPGSRGLLEYTTEAIVNATFSSSYSGSSEPSGLKNLITPVTNRIIQISGEILECWVQDKSPQVTTIIKRFCDKPKRYARPLSNSEINCPVSNPIGDTKCCFLFADSTLSDLQIGVILLFISLLIIIVCLVTLVKVLNSVLKGAVQQSVKKYINSDIPCAPWSTGYFALVIGAIITVLMQSSSIFTSLLTPLIGMGVVTIERCYPLTLGSNIGTTATALLAAFTENSKLSVQIALVHLLFNTFGIFVFYPFPFMRFPIPMCKFLGKITAQYRWFAAVYIVALFVVMPCTLLLLSSAGSIVFWTSMGLVFALFCIVVLINILQKKIPEHLPVILQSWDFLPMCFRSLQPYDKVIVSAMSLCCKKNIASSQTTIVTENELKGLETPTVHQNGGTDLNKNDSNIV